jgi:methyl-accepting chemotaxis protein
MNIFARILAGYALTLLSTLGIAAVAVVQVGQMENATNRGAGANAQLIVGLIVVLAVLITVAIGVFIARSISVPLGQITVAANRIGDGELIETPSFARQDEIGVLAGALTRMMQGQRKLAERERTAKEESAKTITRYIAFVARVADRDLSGTLEVSGNGEIAALGRDLNKMNANLRELAVQIQDATNDLGSGVSEILAAASEQTSSAANQATAIQETTATINAIRTTVEQTSQRSGQVASMARDSVKATDDGRGSVESTIESMAAIKAQVEGIAQNILALSGQGQQIGDIITTVNDFAEQSNLLALNAAIEAARAGEHGKGFAVVASEVRNLAEQSKVATTRVRELLSEIQKATNSAVMVTEEGLKGVESGSKNVDGAGTAIKSLSETIRRTRKRRNKSRSRCSSKPWAWSRSPWRWARSIRRPPRRWRGHGRPSYPLKTSPSSANA